ncbi:hypothetical protein ANFP_10230 [Acidithiobacillus ferrooxidans]|nr:hypothetical protein ANFP_10230 [Acidithiobacillus ferrooxidans]
MIHLRARKVTPRKRRRKPQKQRVARPIAQNVTTITVTRSARNRIDWDPPGRCTNHTQSPRGSKDDTANTHTH